MPRLIAALLVVLATAATPARGVSTESLATAVAGAIRGMVQPAHQDFVAAAISTEAAVGLLCAAPSANRLDAARARFRDLALAFSRIEPFRFGPAREDNRYERLFFWPDRRDRGFRQVMDTLRTEEPNAAMPDLLAEKSVALQGLPALELVLFGRGANAIADPPSGFRCAYGEAITRRVVVVATALNHAWSGAYAQTMIETGPANPIYRDPGEALQALLRAAREQLQVAIQFKLARIMGMGDDPPKPAAAPFAKAGLGIATTLANTAAVADLLAAMSLEEALPEENANMPSELRIYLEHAAKAITDAQEAGDDWPAVLADEAARHRIAYVPLALGDAAEILEGRLPAALGLIAGFNSLDGD